MNVSPVSYNNTYSFSANSNTKQKNSKQNTNPVSKTGEKAVLAKAAFIAGLGLGGKLLLLTLGASAGLIGLFIGGVALLYTLFKAPSINYKGNINAFKKGKDMDVYIKGNEAEKELYTQMNNKAKTATDEEKEKLRMQYAQMQMAKNTIPDFIKSK